MSKIKTISAVLGLVIALGAALPLSMKAHKWLAGTPALAEQIRVISDKVKANSEAIEREADERRMEVLQKRMWMIEERWAERFLAEYNYHHKTIAELLAFMVKEDRERYREADSEYEALLEKWRAIDKAKAEARAKKEKDDE